MKETLKIMKTKPEVSDEEIRSYMNFDRLVSEHQAASVKKNKTIKFIAAGTALIGLSLFLFWYVQPVNNKPLLTAEQQKTAPHANVPVESKKDPEVKTVPVEKELISSQQEVTKPKAQKEKLPVQEKNTVKNESASIVVTPAYSEAEPVDGFPHLYEYFNSELTYPAEAVKDSLQGIVTVNFVINKEGRPEDIKVINSLGPLFDKEVLRLIGQMPAWKPARMNGKPARAKISLPLTFRIEKTKK